MEKRYWSRKKPYVKPQRTTSNSSSTSKAEAQPDANINADFITRLKNSIKREIDSALETALNSKIDEIKQNVKTQLTSSLNSYIDTKIRYNVEQRLGLMFNNDELTTRGACSFSISDDSQSGGKSFMFKYQGSPVAKITENGWLYCKMLFIGGVSILELINTVFKNFEQIGDNYVRHEDLKNGTYEMNIEDIITNTETINKKLNITSDEETPLVIQNTKEEFPDGRFTIIKIDDKEIKHDRWNDSILINDLLEVVNWGNSWQTMLYSYSHFNYFLHNNVEVIIGKEDIQGDSVEFMFNFSGSDSASNNLSVAFWDYPSIIQLYRDSIQTYGNVYDNTDHYIQNDGNLYILNSSLGYNASKFVVIGKTNTNYNAGEIKFVNLNGDTSNYLRLALVDSTNTTGHVDIFKGEVDINVPTIVSVSGSSNVLSCYGNSETNRIKVGQNESYKHAVITCYSPATLANRYLSLGLDAYTFNLVIYYNKVEVNKQLNVNDKLYVQGNAEVNMNLTVNKALHILGNVSDMLYSALTAGNDVVFTLGKNSNTYGSAQLGYHLDSTLANSYAYLTLTAMSGLKVWADKVESITPFYCPSLYVNGTQFDPTNVAYTNVSNTFTTDQTIKGDLTLMLGDLGAGQPRYLKYYTRDGNGNLSEANIGYHPTTSWDGSCLKFNIEGNDSMEIHKYSIRTSNRLLILDPNAAMNLQLEIQLGKDTTNNYNALITRYHHSSDASTNNYTSIGYKGALDVIDLYPNKIVMTQPLTAPKYETTNNTAATAIGSNLTNAINELIDAKAGNVIHHEIKDEQKGMTNCFMAFEARETMPGYSVCYSDELKLFVGTCYNQSYAYYSNDGMDWTRVSSPSSPIMCVCYGDGGFITCPYNGTTVLHSNDGLTWESYGGRLVNITSGWTCVNWCYDVYIAIGKSTQYFCLSVDGYDWYQQDFGLSTTWNWVCYGNNVGFVAVGNSGNYAYAPLGMGSWTTGTLPNTYNFNSVVYGKNGFVAVGNGLYGAISTNGTTWTQITMPDNKNWTSITYGVGRYIAIPSSGSKAAVSFNGTTWITYNLPSNYWKQITYGNGIFTAVSDGAYTYATYISNRTFLSARSILSMIYPVGSIYTSMVYGNPATILGFGTWTQITNRFLYCSNSSKTTGGSDTHIHPLSDNGYAKIATHGAGNFVIRERGTPQWTPTHKMPTGAYQAEPSYDQYGQCLGGETDSASSLPPYITCYAWYRTA